MHDLRWLGHSGFLVMGSEQKIYVDPYSIEKGVLPKADIILITHPHYDHFSLDDIKDISNENTIIIGPDEIEDKLSNVAMKKFIVMVPEKELKIKDAKIIGISAYNINKDFHKQVSEWLGYIVEISNKRYYFAGDTDRIPEMKSLGPIDVACMPVSGVYVMDYKEAADAVIQDIKPRIAIPSHFGSIVGSSLDAEKFVKIVEEKGIKSEMLDKK